MPYFCKVDGLDNIGENTVVQAACTQHHQEQQFKTWNFCDQSALPFSRIFCAAIRANTLQDTEPALSFLVPLYPFALPILIYVEEQSSATLSHSILVV